MKNHITFTSKIINSTKQIKIHQLIKAIAVPINVLTKTDVVYSVFNRRRNPVKCRVSHLPRHKKKPHLDTVLRVHLFSLKWCDI